MLNVLSKKKFVPVSCVLYGLSIMWLTSVMSVRIFPVPMTMQTCGVQVIAFLMSPVQAFYAVGSWLMAGVLGFVILIGALSFLFYAFWVQRSLHRNGSFSDS
jgi:biotin transporter BioY